MWYIEKLYPGTSIGIISATLKLKGSIDYCILEKAVNRLIEFNDAIRIRIREIDSIPMQYVVPYQYQKLDFVDFSQKGYDSLYEWDMLMTQEPFKLTESSLSYFALVKASDKEGGVFIKLHHIVSDAWSFVYIIGNKIVENYRYFCRFSNVPDDIEKSGLDALPVAEKNPSYLECIESEANYLKSERFQKDKLYWNEVFKTAPEYTTLKANRSERASMPAKRKTFVIPSSTTAMIRNFCRSTGTTIFAVFAAALTIYLNRVLQREDIVLGTPVLNRCNAREKNMLGMFVTNVPIRIGVADDVDFNTFSTDISRNWLRVLKHQKYPYQLLLKDIREKFGNIDSLYDILISYQNAKLNRIDVELKYEGRWHFNGYQVDSLYIHINDREDEGNLIVDYDFLSKLFYSKEIEYIHRHLMNLIHDALAHPSKKLYEIEFMDMEEKHRILYDFNNARADYPLDKTVHRLFEQRVEKSPNDVALVFKDNETTYVELNRKANRIAWLLREKGIKPDDIVGEMLSRSPDLLAAIMCLLKAGGAYLPIDPELPDERIRIILCDSGASALLIKDAANGRIDLSDEPIEVIDFNTACTNTENPPEVCSSDNLSYVMYTSGSTGTPKGAMIEHRSLVNFSMAVTDFFGFAPGERVMSIATMSFDIFIFEIFPSLINGMTIIMADEEQRKLPVLLGRLMDQYRADVIHATPSIIQHLLDDDECAGYFSGLKKIIIGGEVFTDKLLSRLKSVTKALIYNGYGPAETTVGVAFKELTSSHAINIGKPISNTRIYILDKHLNPVPIGMPGEIFIGGNGLARGYINRPELNLDKFLPDPFIQNGRIYKTGDLGRWYPEGDIEFLGRMDQQVKIRGLRVELGEIENELLGYEGVKKVVVVDNEDKYGKKYLCAYIVSDKKIQFKELRDYLSKSLPAYMIPAAFVRMNDIPLNPSGKIDRNSLPQPDSIHDLSDNYEAPSSETEEKFSNIWADVLHIDRVGTNDNFFELGGDSLSLISIVAHIRKELDIELPLTQMYDNPTVRELSRCVKDAEKRLYVPLEPAGERPYYPVSSAQKRIFLLNQIENAGTSYNMPLAAFIDGNLDIGRLENVFKVLVKRHDSFRTSFGLIDGVPVQRICDDVEFKMEYGDIQEIDTDKVIERFIKPFDLEKAPLLRVGVYKVAGDKYLFLADMHHIISDGISSDILMKEIDALYRGEELPGLSLQYKDYSVWCEEYFKTDLLKKQEKYWLDVFSEELPAVDFPTDYPRPPVQSFKGGSITFNLGHEFAKDLKQLALENRATNYMIMMAAFNILISKYTGQEDIVIGSPVAGRGLTDLGGVVGMFVNTLPMRNKPDGSKRFDEFLAEVRSNTLNAFENQDYPFEELVSKLKLKRDLSRNPLFDMMFILQKTDVESFKIGNLAVSPIEVKNMPAKFDLSLDAIERDGDFTFTLQYCTDLFKKQTAERIGVHFTNILKAVISDPSLRLSQIDMLSRDERRRIIVDFNETYAACPPGTTIVGLFEEQAHKAPDACAVEFHDKRLSYSELNSLSNKLAYKLRSNGLKPDDIVAVMLNRSPEILVAILGVLKAGGAYLPIDPDYPEKRIEYMLNDSGVKTLITRKGLKDGISFKGEVVDVDSAGSYAGDGSNPENINKPEDLIYILYTSGSTGNPKGVMITHKSVVNFVRGMTQILDFSRIKTVVSITTISFDLFVLESLLPLANGSKIVIADEEQQRIPSALNELVVNSKVDLIQTTPSRMQLLLDDGNSLDWLAQVSCIVMGGEPLPPVILKRTKELTDARIYNMYAPTETTIHSVAGEVTNADIVHIGKPIINERIYILDKYMNPVPVGVTGEVYIGGDGLARGYLNNTELTEERFVPDPFITNNKVYKTGDLARWLPDGCIEHLGRIDNQLKIKGFRIEPGEVENKIYESGFVKEAAVVGKTSETDEKRLYAYIVVDYPDTFDLAKLRAHLSKTLPEYMVPSRLLIIEKMPLTPNGKIDRKVLVQRKEAAETQKSIFHSPSGPIEERLARIWSDVLKVEKIGAYDNFFELGGDSFAVIKAVTKAFACGMKITIQDFYKYQTLRQIASRICDNKINENEEEHVDKTVSPSFNEFIKTKKASDNSQTGSIAKNILLTGATGFLGIHILHELIKDTDANIYCLVRAKSGKNSKDRLIGTLRFYFDNDFRKLIGTRIIPVDGDLRYDRFGLSRDMYNEFGNKVDLIIHAAATVKHYGDYSEFEEINVKATGKIIDFAERFKSALCHISTISVVNGIFDNYYVRSKHEAEKLVMEAAKKGIDVSVARVGNLTGRYSDGCFQMNMNENAFYNRLKSIIEIGAISDEYLERLIELTPVDYCSKAIVQLLNLRGGRVFHLYNNNCISFSELIDMLNANGFNVRRIDTTAFTDLIAQIAGDNGRQTILSGIINDLIGIDSQKFKIDPALYAPDETLGILSQANFKWPVVDNDYINKIIKNMISSGHLELRSDEAI